MTLFQKFVRRFNVKPKMGLEELSYMRLVEKGFSPDGIIDVGAYEGNWTRLARRVFPKAPILMVEAQESKKAKLNAVRAELSDISYEPALIGKITGQSINFYEMETGSSYFPEQSNAPRNVKTLMTRTLDEIAVQMPCHNLFLKVDVQGAELEVLGGGNETLKRCAAIQLEVAMLPYNEGAPTMLEVLQYMDARDFVPFDISGESRPTGHLVQIDMIFTPRNSHLRPTFITF